jgi:hypothetical protein
VNAALEQLLRLKADHQRVLLAFATHDRFDGNSAAPALRWLAAVTGISLSRIGRVVQEMEALGYHRIQKRGRDSSRYVLAAATVRMMREAGLIVAKAQCSISESQRSKSESQRLANGTGEEGRESLIEREESEGAEVFHKNIYRASSTRYARPLQASLLLPITGNAAAPINDAPAARAGPEADAKKTKRDNWLSALGEYVRDIEPRELERFWTEAMKPPEEARAYLNAIDQRMRASWWWRERRRRSG